MIENVLGGFNALSEWSKQRTAGSSQSGSLFEDNAEYGHGFKTVHSILAAPAAAYRWPALNSVGAGTDEDMIGMALPVAFTSPYNCYRD